MPYYYKHAENDVGIQYSAEILHGTGAILFNEHRRESLGAISAWLNRGFGEFCFTFTLQHKRNITYVSRICGIMYF